MDSALKLASEIVDLAHRQDSVIPQVMGHYSLGMALFYDGDFSESLAHLEHGLSLYREYYDSCSTPLYGIDIGVTCPPIYAARVWWHLGYPEKALKNIQEGLALARQTPHAYSLAHALDWAAAVHLHRGEAAAAKEHAKAVITLAEEHGFEYLGVRATVFLGATLCRQGLFDEGIAQMMEGLERHTRLKTKHLVTCFAALLSEAYARTNQIEAGLSTVAAALDLVQKTGERWYESELHRLKGELHLRQRTPDPQQANFCFRCALAIARRQDAKSWELRAATSLARLGRDQGERAQAHDLLAPVYGWFTEGFDTADLKDAKALLEELA